jgi:acetyl esterase/lipase
MCGPLDGDLKHHLRMLQFVTGGDYAKRDPDVDPFYAPVAGMPPLYISAARYEMLHAPSVAYAQRAASEGVEVKLAVGDNVREPVQRCAV